MIKIKISLPFWWTATANNKLKKIIFHTTKYLMMVASIVKTGYGKLFGWVY